MGSDEQAAVLEALDHPGLQRILAALLSAVQRTGEPPATIKIQNPEEADALRGLAGGKHITGKSIRTAELERRLREHSRFKYPIRQLLEIRYGRIVSKRELRQQTDTDWSEALARLQEVACRTAPPDLCRRVFKWIEADRKAFRTRYNRQRSPALERDLRIVVNALSLLPRGEFVLLAQLGEQAAHDPHAFDAGQTAGSLLDLALIHLFPGPVPGSKGSARWRRRLLASAGIQRDSVSSHVNTFGLLLSTPTPPAPAALGLDCTWTLRALLRVRDELRAAENVVWVVENPTVFEALLDRLEPLDRAFEPTIVCTNGRLNLADEVLLDALVKNGARILYSGDFDADGLQIALDVRERYPDRSQLWHMEVADYRSSVRAASPRLRWKGLPRARAALPELVSAMSTEGRVAYQEALIDRLFEDIALFTRTRKAPRAVARRR